MLFLTHGILQPWQSKQLYVIANQNSNLKILSLFFAFVILILSNINNKKQLSIKLIG